MRWLAIKQGKEDPRLLIRNLYKLYQLIQHKCLRHFRGVFNPKFFLFAPFFASFAFDVDWARPNPPAGAICHIGVESPVFRFAARRYSLMFS